MIPTKNDMIDIRFRIWNGREMIYDVMVGKFGAFYVNPGSKGNGLDENDSASLTPFNTKYPDSTPVMRYTGFPDCNGVDIFQGDLVAGIDKIEELDEWGDPLTVEFGEFVSDEDTWGLPCVTTGFLLRYKGGEITGLHNRKNCYGFESKDMMIIGHIYEEKFKELIKE